MPNPLSPISPVLELLGKEVKILPATGGAVEDLQHPDQEEIEDILINRDMDTVTAFAETLEPDPQNIYHTTLPLPRSENHLFRFFIDGSIRTYFLGTGIEGTRSFPIELAQIGATVVKREDNSELRVFAQIPDAYFTLESIISEIKEGIRNNPSGILALNLLSFPRKHIGVNLRSILLAP